MKKFWQGSFAKVTPNMVRSPSQTLLNLFFLIICSDIEFQFVRAQKVVIEVPDENTDGHHSNVIILDFMQFSE